MSTAAFKYDTFRWPDLSDLDRLAWQRIRASRPALGSPFFSLDWHDAVQATRGGVEVLRLARGGETCGFFPFVRCAFGMLRSAGAPMADWHGLVGAAGLSLSVEEVLRAAHGKAFRFSGAAGDDPLLDVAHTSSATSFLMDLSGGYDAYAVNAKKAHPQAFQNLRTAGRKLLDRNVEIRLDDRDPANLELVLAMKRTQYRRTRQIDIFGVRWTRALIERLFSQMPATPRGARGLLSTLWIDGALAAGHFGLMGDATLHYWFPVYDDRFANLSPGIALLHEIAKGSSLLDIERIDLGDGDYRFKRQFANQHLPLIAGTARVSHGGNRMRLSLRHTSAGGVPAPAGALMRIPHALTRRVELLASLHS